MINGKCVLPGGSVALPEGLQDAERAESTGALIKLGIVHGIDADDAVLKMSDALEWREVRLLVPYSRSPFTGYARVRVLPYDLHVDGAKLNGYFVTITDEGKRRPSCYVLFSNPTGQLRWFDGRDELIVWIETRARRDGRVMITAPDGRTTGADLCLDQYDARVRFADSVLEAAKLIVDLEECDEVR